MAVESCYGSHFQPVTPHPVERTAALASGAWTTTVVCTLSPAIRVSQIATDLPAREMAAAAAPVDPMDAVIAAPLHASALRVSAQPAAVAIQTRPRVAGIAAAQALPPAPAAPAAAHFNTAVAGPADSIPREVLPGAFLPLGAAQPEAVTLPAQTLPLPCRGDSVCANLLTGWLTVEASILLPRFAPEAFGLAGLAAAGAHQLPARPAEGDRSARVLEGIPAEVAMQHPAAIAAAAIAAIGDPQTAISSAAHAACVSHPPCLADALAYRPGSVTGFRDGLLTPLPPQEFLDAIDAAGIPPEAGLAAVRLVPALPASPQVPQAASIDADFTPSLPGFECALAAPALAAASVFRPALGEAAVAGAKAAKPAGFLPLHDEMRLPTFRLQLAAPPVPHVADVSPDAAPGTGSLRAAAPNWTGAPATLPGFALRPELTPIPAPAFGPAAPPQAALRTAAPIVSAPSMALPHPAIGIENSGGETAFAPMAVAVRGLSADAVNVTQGWLETAGGVPLVAAETAARLDLAPPAYAWPAVASCAGVPVAVVRLELLETAEPEFPALPAAAQLVNEPALAAPIAVELYVQRGRTTASHTTEWCVPRLETLRPHMTVAPVSFAVEQSLNPKPVPEALKVRRMPSYSRSEVTLWGKGMAAAVAVCAFLWMASVAVRTRGGETREIAGMSTGADPIALNQPPEAPRGNGVRQRVRRAIANRAKLEVGTDFRDGRDFWNGYKPSWGKGWQRHPDGYAKPGAMALLRPTLELTDYRMEFLGQIEDRSLSWAFRAHDTDNYYAMKLNVVVPGLRPLISVSRYAVVNGKRGRKVETPLPVMMHNGRPYHVAVEVRGNRFTTSVEGETIDSFVDDALAKGGVGFFSEGVERARVYWVRVTNNDDLLGRICAYVTGKRGGPAETAFTGGGTFDDETGRRRAAESAGMLPWERQRKKRAGLGQTATVLTA